MFLTSWLCGLRGRLERPYWRSRRRRLPCQIDPIAAQVERLETRALLAGVLVETTPTLTVNAVEGHSTGNLVLATFTYNTPPVGLFTKIAPPGSIGSEATGISGNSVVGNYWYGTTGHVNGFLYNGSTFTTLNPPGSTDTRVTGISGNNIVGFFYTGYQTGVQGFLYDGSTYTILDPPGATSSMAFGISGNNVIGLDVTDNLPFLYNGSTYTTIRVPGADDTTVTGVSGDVVVGHYRNFDNHGFLFQNGTYTTFDVPGTIDTEPTGISGNNVVGIYELGGGFHSFLYDGSTFNTSIDPPGAGIFPNDAGAKAVDGSDIVGRWIDPTIAEHGFLYNGSTTMIVDVPGAVSTDLTAVSNGNVVGLYNPAGPGYQQAFLYQPGSIQAGFVPSVNWGGPLAGTPTVSVQLVSQTATSSTWKVMGNATYLDEGTHAVAVSVNDGLGNSVQTNKITLNVVDAPLINTTPPVTHTALEGNSTGNIVLATFTDLNPSATPVDYHIPINWGGALVVGSAPTASLMLVSRTANASTWQIVGSAVYAARGIDTISLSVIDVGGGTLFSNSTIVNVADAPLADTTPAITRNVRRFANTGNVVVATFSDSDPFASASEFAASVNWGGPLVGQNTVSIQLVSRSATSSTWQVIASAAYRNKGAYLVAVTVFDQEGSSFTSKKTRFVVG